MSQSGVTATPQYIQNSSFDPEFGVLVFNPQGYDGQNMVREPAGDMQIKAVVNSPYTYFCFAAVGTPEATALWKIFRLDDDGNKVYADGNANFDNSASNPASLTYSYS